MRGDILFYTPTDWIGSLVAWATNGPFCHVAIDMGDRTMIEADSHGIVRISTPNRAPAATFNTARYVPKLEDRMPWLQQQLGNPYGAEDTEDIVNQVLQLMGFKFYIGEPKGFDWTDLAAMFLIHSNAGWLLGRTRTTCTLSRPTALLAGLEAIFRTLPGHQLMPPGPRHDEERDEADKHGDEGPNDWPNRHLGVVHTLLPSRW